MPYKDIEKRKNNRRKYYAKNREKILDNAKRWRSKNVVQQREYHNEYFKKWRAKYPELASSIWKRWYTKNRDYNIARQKIRRDRKRSAEGRYCSCDIKHLYKRQSGLCFYCAISLNNKYHIDHIKPLSKGGTNWRSNLALSCESCNLRKNDKTIGWGQHWVHHQG